MQPQQQIYSIQFLRAIAVSLVVYAHSIDLVEYLHLDSFQANFKSLQNFGAIGVDIFFIISGFIMAYVTANVDSSSKIKSFFKKRLLRLYVLFIPITLLLIFYKKPALGSVLKNIFLLPIFDTGTEFILPSLNVAWTLSFELFFYIIITIAIIINKKQSILIAVLILSILILIGLLMPNNEVHFVFATNPIYIEFILGLILGKLYLKKIKIPFAISTMMLVAAIVNFGYLIYYGYGNISEANYILDGTGSLWRVFLWGIPSFLFVGSIIWLFQHPLKPDFFKKTLMLIGDASYSVYLTHTLFFSGFIHLKKFILPINNGDVLIILFLVAATVMGCLVYFFVEKPLLQFAKNKLL